MTQVNAKWGGLESETGPRAPSPQDSKRTNDAWGSLSEHWDEDVNGPVKLGKLGVGGDL